MRRSAALIYKRVFRVARSVAYKYDYECTVSGSAALMYLFIQGKSNKLKLVFVVALDTFQIVTIKHIVMYVQLFFSQQGHSTSNEMMAHGLCPRILFNFF